MNTKKCAGECGKELTIDNFYKQKRGKFGVRGECKQCCNKKKKERNNPPNTDDSIKKVCVVCGEEFPAIQKYFHKSRGGKFGVRADCKVCYNKRRNQRQKDNRNKTNEYSKNRWHNDEQYRIRKLLSRGLRHSLNNIGQSKNASILDYIGCDIEFLKQHLNNSKDDSWGDITLDIDHIIPQSLYDFTNEEEIKKVYNWRNLRYLPKPENISKGDTLFMELVEEYDIYDLLPDL